MAKHFTWQPLAQKILKSTTLAVAAIFVLTVAIGTYGIHLLDKQISTAEKQSAAYLPNPTPIPPAAPTVQVLTETTESKPQVEAEAKDEPEKTEDKPSLRQKVDPAQVADLTAPCEGVIVRGFGWSRDPLYEDYRYHDSVDYSVGDNPAIKAAQKGVISAVEEMAGQGIVITIAHQNSQSCYSGLSTAAVAIGQTVSQGQTIGTLADGILHFTVWQ